jgi:hypothetical protein
VIGLVPGTTYTYANVGGVALGRGSADWVAGPEAQSVVVHYILPGGTTAGGPKIACADLD